MTSPISRWLGSLRARLEPAPEPERLREIREGLKWFNRFEGPPEELVAWFAQVHPAPTDPEAPEVLSLATAIERRKWILRGTAEHADDRHFDGRSNWLPLIAWGKGLFIYESGPARSGLVLRRVDRRDQYLKDRARPLPLPTFDLARLTQPLPPAPHEEPEPLERLLPSAGVAPRVGEWVPGERLPFFKDGVPRELLAWFSAHDGQPPGATWFPPHRVHSRWRALGLDEAGVFRDLLLERATAALAAELQRDPRWVPLFVIDDAHLLVYSEPRGVAVHARSGEHYAPVPWSRWSLLASFLEVSRAVLEPTPRAPAVQGALVDDLPWRLVDELQIYTGDLEEPLVQREGLSVDDQGSIQGFGLEAWFAPNVGRPGPPLLAVGEHALSGSEALALRAQRAVDRPWFPLATGEGGVVTGWFEGLGVAELRPGGALAPLNATFTGWLEGLLFAAEAEREARAEPGHIHRTPMGVWKVDVAPLIAKDLVAALHALPWSFTRSGYTLTLERAQELGVRAEAHTRLVLQLTDPVIDQMIADLEALDGFEPATLHWEEVHDLVLVVRPRV